MEKVMTSVQLNDSNISFIINKPESIFSKSILEKNIKGSNLQLNNKFHHSSKTQFSLINLGTQTNQFERSNKNELYPNITVNNNNIKINQKQKGLEDEILQKIATSLMLSQIPKKNINKFFDTKLLNSFSKMTQQQSTFKSISLIKNNENNNMKQDNFSSTRHRKFSEEEDERLKNIVFTFGPKNWRLIASLMPDRTPRQCRDRYSNYLAPGFIHSEWTKEEDNLLAEKYTLLGPKWTQIRQFFPFRTANDIKNRFNYTVSKKIELTQTNNESTKKNSNEKDTSFFENDIIELNQEMFCLFNDDMQANDFDYIFMNN